MLVRIVRMTLQPAKLEDFKSMFSHVSPKIRSFEGCTHLELLYDARYPHIVTTLSHWTTEKQLNLYRESRLFLNTWSQTREWFAAPPVAHSYYADSESSE